MRHAPAAAVAPERNILGVESISADQSGFLTDTGYSKMRFRDTHWLNTLRQKAAIDLAGDR